MRTPFLIALYLLAIVAATLLVAADGPAISIVNALVFIAFDITARDQLHEAWGHNHLLPKMAALILAGSALSAVFNLAALPIAIASCVAFGVSATLDGITYALLKDRERLLKINGSNVVSALADSLIFPALAFGFPLLWPIVLGQFLAKVLGGLVWSLLLTPFRRWPAARGAE